MMILWRVNRIRDPSEHEKELALEENSESDFIMVLYPTYEKETGKLLGITEEVGQVVILGDPNDRFFNNGFGGDEKPLWSGYRRNKMKNLFSCTLSPFMKYPIKNNLHDTAERSKIFCYTAQLCDRKEEANKANKSISNIQPYVPFVNINIKTFGEGFKPTDLLSDNEEKRLLSRSCVKKVMRLMIKNNKKVVNNLDNVIRHLPNDRVFTVFSKKYNNYSSSRFVLSCFFFFFCLLLQKKCRFVYTCDSYSHI